MLHCFVMQCNVILLMLASTEVHQRNISYSQPANQYRQRLSSSFLPRGKLSSQLTYLLLTDHIEKLKLGKTGTFLAKNNIIFGISIKICLIEACLQTAKKKIAGKRF